MPSLKPALVLFALLWLLPLGVSALLYQRDGVGQDWRSAERGSAGLLPPAAEHSPAVVRVFAAPTVRWRGIFAVHSWLVLKPEGAAGYTRYDYTAWGDPVRVNGFAADGRWFGRMPEVVFAVDGAEAAAMIPRMREAIEGYAWRSRGDYRVWPGPNSNTFVAAVLDAVPEAGAWLPPNAVGKDFPYDGSWLRRTASGTGLRLSLGGFAGLTLGWVEGIEVNILGAVAGLDLRRPALKLPGLGRVGLPPLAATAAPTPIAATVAPTPIAAAAASTPIAAAATPTPIAATAAPPPIAAMAAPPALAAAAALPVLPGPVQAESPPATQP